MGYKDDVVDLYPYLVYADAADATIEDAGGGGGGGGGDADNMVQSSVVPKYDATIAIDNSIS